MLDQWRALAEDVAQQVPVRVLCERYPPTRGAFGHAILWDHITAYHPPDQPDPKCDAWLMRLFVLLQDGYVIPDDGTELVRGLASARSANIWYDGLWMVRFFLAREVRRMALWNSFVCAAFRRPEQFPEPIAKRLIDSGVVIVDYDWSDTIGFSYHTQLYEWFTVRQQCCLTCLAWLGVRRKCALVRKYMPRELTQQVARMVWALRFHRRARHLARDEPQKKQRK